MEHIIYFLVGVLIALLTLGPIAYVVYLAATQDMDKKASQETINKFIQEHKYEQN